MRVLSTSLFLSIFSLVLSKAIEDTNSLFFNLESGFYSDDSIELQIETLNSNASIYYTLDGSIPSENSTLYENPIVLKDKSEEENVYSAYTNVETSHKNFKPAKKITKCNIVRAIAKFSDGSFSEIVSNTYFVGLDRKKIYGDVPIISIITDPDNLFGDENGIYVVGKKYEEWLKKGNRKTNSPKPNYNVKGRESERPASIEYFPSDESQKGFKQNMGIRIMGNASRSAIQKSFRITFREEYGKKNLKYNLIPDNMRSDGNGPVTKYKSFNLRNGGNDNEFMKFRDPALQHLISNRNFETQQYDIAVVFIDGEYWGVYIVNEDYSGHYIANNYDIDDKNVIIIKKYKVEEGEENDYDLFKETIDYINSNDMSLNHIYNNVLKSFDVKSFAWNAAFNIYIGSVDSIMQNNNWAMWRVRTPVSDVLNGDGKWRILAFDNEFSSGLYTDGLNYNQTYLPDIFNKNSSLAGRFGTVLLNKLMENDNFKNIFINALCDIRNIDFEVDRINSYMDYLYNKTEPLMLDNYNRFGPNYVLYNPKGYYKNQFSYWRVYLQGRYSVFMEHVQQTFNFKKALSVSIQSNDYKKGSFKVNNGWKIHDKDYEGEYFGENILYVTAVPVNGREFKYWEVNNCEFADIENGSPQDNQSIKITIGIYPKKGCSLTAYYE